MYQTLLVAISEQIATITINRPEKLNALNREVLSELAEALEKVWEDGTVKAILITGAGPKAFVAGADISEFLGLSVSQGKELARKGQELFFKIEQSPKPVLAAVNGFALGGGCELAMSCHIRIASDNARFGQPEINLGIMPGYGGTQRLTQLIGKGRALEMLLTGNMTDAATALQYGLVNKICPPDELIPVSRELLKIIISKAPLAVSKTIAAVNKSWGSAREGYQEELEGFGSCFGTEDMTEGVTAFLEKRKPVFKGR